MRARHVTLPAGAALGLLLVTAPGAAQIAQGEGWSLTLGGYARALGGANDLGYDPGTSERRSAFSGGVARLKWLFEVDRHVRVSVHNRLQAVVSSAAGRQNVLGFGVSAVPKRTVDMVTTIAEGDHGRVWHDIDRLSVSVYLDVADVTLGRQAITWGVSNLFPVADLWAQFSPFELDTEEKPGADAIRILTYPATGVELDIVAADRGTLRDLSAGARATVELPVGDVWFGAGKFWRELMPMGGVSFVVGTWKLRAEAVFPWEMDAEEWLTPRFTAGADWITTDVIVSVEYHLNGLGSTESADYLSLLTQPQFQRGETYYLGRHYVGGSVSYLPTDRLTLALAALGNLNDPSTALLPAVNYDMGQAIRINFGGLVSFGAKPTSLSGAIPRLESEYGTYGHFGYAQLSVYF
jgi:hypothetical protein